MFLTFFVLTLELAVTPKLISVSYSFLETSGLKFFESIEAGKINYLPLLKEVPVFSLSLRGIFLFALLFLALAMILFINSISPV